MIFVWDAEVLACLGPSDGFVVGPVGSSANPTRCINFPGSARSIAGTIRELKSSSFHRSRSRRPRLRRRRSRRSYYRYQLTKSCWAISAAMVTSAAARVFGAASPFGFSSSSTSGAVIVDTAEWGRCKIYSVAAVDLVSWLLLRCAHSSLYNARCSRDHT